MKEELNRSNGIGATKVNGKRGYGRSYGYDFDDDKMKEEESLSEKIKSTSPDDFFIEVKDIKEFIKICLAEGYEKQSVEYNKDFIEGIQFMKDIITRRAGDKLNDNR